MTPSPPFHRPVAGLITFVLICAQLCGAAPVQAALVSTAQSLPPLEADATRTRLKAMLDREDVRRQLAHWGVDPAEARARVDSLTETELARLAAQMDTRPAGGGALEIFIVSALIIFLVLLFTDIAGYTDIFPFVR